MKTNIKVAITIFVLTALFTINVMAKGGVGVSEVRNLKAFSSIEVTSVATVYFTQSDTYSFKIEGKEEYVKNTVSTVNDGCLVIGFKDGDKKRRQRKESVTIYISAPDLKKLDFEGVGSFNSETPLKLNDISITVEGVGNVNVKDLTCRSLSLSMEGVGKGDIHVNCQRLRTRMEGVGSVTLSGTAAQADISKDGIGNVNTHNLKVGK